MHKQRSLVTTPAISDKRRISWYAAIFNVEQQVYDVGPDGKTKIDYTEVIRPGAFKDALASGADVIATVDHKEEKTFARSRNDLLLQEDQYGLYCSTWLNDDPLGNAILADVSAGNLTGSSLKFLPVKERWTGPNCELITGGLKDVTITANPYYVATIGTVKLRTAQDRLRELFLRHRLVKMKVRG